MIEQQNGRKSGLATRGIWQKTGEARFDQNGTVWAKWIEMVDTPGSREELITEEDIKMEVRGSVQRKWKTNQAARYFQEKSHYERHKMKIITYNVNGIRSALSKIWLGFQSYRRQILFCLQEIKVNPEQIFDLYCSSS